MKKTLLLLITGFICQSGFSQKIIEKNYKPLFEKYGVAGCFVLYNQADDTYIRHNASLCDTGYIPASTFKIPHSIIALEEGVVKDANQIIPWDGHEWEYDKWNKDQTLKTAVKYSCIWAFFDIAKQINIEKYQEYVNDFDYGNKNLTGPPTRFWLAGEFRISANQQIEFLKKFYNYELPVSKQSIDIVKDLIILKQTENYTFSGKTGGGQISGNKNIMWLVGYVEKDGNPYFYAMNFVTEDSQKDGSKRYKITKDILRELKLIE